MGRAVVPFKRPRLVEEKEDEFSAEGRVQQEGRVHQEKRVVKEGQEGGELRQR